MRKIVASMLSLLLIIPIYTNGINAQEITDDKEDKAANEISPMAVSGDFEYIIDNQNTVRINKYTGTSKVLIIPEKIEGKIVSELMNNALNGKTIEKLVFYSKNLRIVVGFADTINLKNATIYGPNNTPSDVEELGGLFTLETMRYHAGHNSIPFKNVGSSEVTFSQNGNSTWSKSHVTRVNVTGHDSSKSLQYVWSTSTFKPSSGWTNFTNGANIKKSTGTDDYYLHIRGTNYLGNDINAISKVFRVDNTNPSLSLSQSPRGDTNGNVTITATSSDAHSGVKRIKKPDGAWINGSSATHSVSTNGTYTFEVEDNTGNQTKKSISVSNIDKTKPTISVSKNGGDWVRKHKEHRTSINITDSESGIASREYQWTTSPSFPISGFTTFTGGLSIIPPTVSGNHYLHLRGVDNAGNTREFTSNAFKVDKVNPSLNITSSTMNKTHEDIVLTAKGSDNYSGIKRIKDPSGSWTSSNEISYKIKENGTYEFVVEDNAENRTTKSITVNNIDKTISFSQPTISKFGNHVIHGKPVAITANILKINVEDWRDTNEWRLDVSASPLKLVNESFYLPIGTMQLKAISDIKQVKGNSPLPTKGFSTKQVIDNGQIVVIKSDESRGEYDVTFPNNALEIVIDPTTAKAGQYESTITWDLVSAP